MEPVLMLNAVLAFAFGTCVGSFLNVCILRIPAGESIVTGPSHCMSCGGRLRWWEMIPLLSWLCLRGRCARCHAPISPQYPLIEAANGLLWTLSYLSLGTLPDALLGALLASALLVASVIDARTREIPPCTTITMAVLALLRLCLNPSAWADRLLGLAVVGGVLALLFLLSGGSAIGGGDVKLMAACGLFLGLGCALLAFLLACLLGSVIHLVRMRFFGAGRDLALGPYLAAGVLIALYWGPALLGWYFSFF